VLKFSAFTSQKSKLRLGHKWPSFFFILVFGWAVALPQAAPAFQAATASFWGSHETSLGASRYFRKWARVLQRIADKKAESKETCDPAPNANCGMFYWSKFIDEIKDKSRPEQIEAVNTYLNRVRYVRDPNNWNVKDYWETPREFFEKQGDCEDYAITKYMTFRRLGYPPVGHADRHGSGFIQQYKPRRTFGSPWRKLPDPRQHAESGRRRQPD
jgi:predicted transglutaminase-like cysteine proteinase